jgi:hypothetical protein
MQNDPYQHSRLMWREMIADYDARIRRYEMDPQPDGPEATARELERIRRWRAELESLLDRYPDVT